MVLTGGIYPEDNVYQLVSPGSSINNSPPFELISRAPLPALSGFFSSQRLRLSHRCFPRFDISCGSMENTGTPDLRLASNTLRALAQTLRMSRRYTEMDDSSSRCTTRRGRMLSIVERPGQAAMIVTVSKSHLAHYLVAHDNLYAKDETTFLVVSQIYVPPAAMPFKRSEPDRKFLIKAIDGSYNGPPRVKSFIIPLLDSPPCDGGGQSNTATFFA